MSQYRSFLFDIHPLLAWYAPPYKAYREKLCYSKVTIAYSMGNIIQTKSAVANLLLVLISHSMTPGQDKIHYQETLQKSELWQRIIIKRDRLWDHTKTFMATIHSRLLLAIVLEERCNRSNQLISGEQPGLSRQKLKSVSYCIEGLACERRV